MVAGVGKGGAAAVEVAQSTQVINTPMNTGGAGDSGGLLSQEQDLKQAATAPKFGEIYDQIQAKYGAKPEKPREIKKSLGKDDFLRIMLTQMKNQDPTNPFKAEQMATEVAQFTTVEQLQNVNQNLTKMSTQNRPLEQMAMTNMIGKTITIDRQRFPHMEGQNESLSFNLPRDAATVKLAIVSEGGETVLEKELGSQKAGEVSFAWDGFKSNTLPAKGGNYMLRVEAKNDKGQNIESNPQAKAQVIGVSFEGNEPVFLVGNAQHHDKVTMRNIVRVDQETGQGKGQSGAAVAPVEQNTAQTPNFFSFQKGVGSGNISPSSLPTIQAAAHVNPQQAQLGVSPQGSPELPPEEKGFPNGLKD